ncbi:MAG: hypothetical protein II839_12220 [Kiritimatiellae bacterium]|nr:hypothetical protein [Kiritimatiellia bacterium]
MKRSVLFVLATALAFPAGARDGAYVVPWYANPVATNVELRIEQTACLAEDSAPVSNAWETVRGSAALAGRAAVAKRLSHSDYFRPRLNVLCDDGAVAVFTLTEALDAVKWTTVVSNAVLAAAAGVPAGSVASDLQVQDDGAFAFLEYGAEWKALGYARPHWSLHVLDADGALVGEAEAARAILKGNATGSAYVSDGKWRLACRRDDYGKKLWIGVKGSTDANPIPAHLDNYQAEFLDLSDGVVDFPDFVGTVDDLTELPIAGNHQKPFLDRMRVYLDPETITVAYNQRGNLTGVEEAVLGSPLVRATSYLNPLSPSNGVLRLVLDFPNLVSWTGGRLATVGTCGNTDFADFHFDSVTNLPILFFKQLHGTGTIDLPSLVRTADSSDAYSSPFYECGAEEIRLSAERRTLERLGARAFRKCTNLRRIVIGGVPGGFVFNQAGASTTMFPDSTKLVDIIFTGGPPLFTDPSLKVFGTRDADSTARNIVFAHPPLDDPACGPAWTSFFAGKTVTPLSLAERRAFQAANPGRPVPYAVAGTDVFLTTYDQYVALVGSEDENLGVSAPSVEWDPAYGSVSVSGAQELEPGSGVYPADAVLTLTATGANGGSFRKWYGDIGENNPTSPVIRVRPAEGAWIHARFVHPWEIVDYNGSYGTAKATDGNFTVHLTEMDEAAHTFTLGKPERMGLFDVTVSDGGATTNMQLGASTVDLGGTFLLDGDDTPWTATAFADVRAGATYPYRYAGRIGTFFSPGTLRGRRLWDVFRPDNPSGIKVRTAYPRVFLDEPELPDYLPDYCFAGTVVTQLVLQVPSVRNFHQTVLWDGKMSGDFAWWDLSSVEDLDERAWCTQYIDDNRRSHLDSLRAFEMNGSLRLPSLRSAKCSPEIGAALSPMPFLQSLELGGRATVTNLDARALAGDSSLTNLVLHADPDLVVGEKVFDDHAGRRNSVDVVYPGHVPERMEFVGKAPNNDVFANLLERVGPKDKPVLVFVRRFDPTWKNAPYLDAPTRAEARLYDGDPDFVFGVYRGSLFGFPYTKALFVQRDFKKTTLLILR